MTPLGSRVPEFIRAPQFSTLFSSTTLLAPSTDKPLTTQFASTAAPDPMMEYRTIAPSATRAPLKRMLPSTIAPSPDKAPFPQGSTTTDRCSGLYLATSRYGYRR